MCEKLTNRSWSMYHPLKAMLLIVDVDVDVGIDVGVDVGVGGDFVDENRFNVPAVKR